MTELSDKNVAIPARESRDPYHRLSQLFDPGECRPLRAQPGSQVVVAQGRVAGVAAIAYCTDGARRGGAIGASGGAQIAAAIDDAVWRGQPVIGLWHSGGANLADGARALDGIGQMFAAMVRASGRVPQISVVLGPAAGGAAYGPALTDVIVMAPAGRVFVTGPDVVRAVTGEQIDMAGLGGGDAQGRRSGVVHVVADSEGDAYLRARRMAALLGAPGRFDLDRDLAPGAGERRDLRALLPEQARRAYDVRALVRRMLDDAPAALGLPAGQEFEELQPRWAPNVVTGLGRLYGRAVGLIANNPLRKGGCLDSPAAEKAARFVRMCDAFGVPLVVIVDVPGYLPGVRQEWDGIVRRGAKLLHAFAEATVPRVTLITRKAYGGAYIAMNSRALGATAVLAWPEAQIAVMGAEAAVGILHRRSLAQASGQERPALLASLVDEHTRTVGSLDRAVEIGVVDAVIDPADSRWLVAQKLAAAPLARGRHGNIPL